MFYLSVRLFRSAYCLYHRCEGQGKNHRIVAMPFCSFCIATISNLSPILLDPFDCHIIESTSLSPWINKISRNIPAHSQIHTSTTVTVILGFLSCVVFLCTPVPSQCGFMSGRSTTYALLIFKQTI